jgi:hypothetical protein
MPYATDSDLTTRIPATAAVSSALRAIALDDAKAWLSERAHGTKLLQSHVLVAAHMLALQELIDPGSPGTVSSQNASEITTSWAVTAPPMSDVWLAGTKYGRQYAAIRRMIPHGPIMG